jgi:hypothetical protein
MIETFTDSHAAILWTQARTREPDITVDELLHFVALHMPTIRTGKIHSPPGYILHTLPPMLEGKALAEYRAAQAPQVSQSSRSLDERIDDAYNLVSVQRQMLEDCDPENRPIIEANLHATSKRLRELEEERGRIGAKRGKRGEKGI